MILFLLLPLAAFPLLYPRRERHPELFAFLHAYAAAMALNAIGALILLAA